MIKIKLGAVSDALGVLNILAPQKLPISTAYNIRKLGDVLFQEFKQTEGIRLKACEEYCENDETGKPLKTKREDGREEFVFTDENRKLFNEEMSELLNQEVDINIRPIPVRVLDSARLSTEETGKLMPFLCE